MPVWQVADRPIADQFAYWREVICQAFVPLSTKWSPAYTAGFVGSVETRALGSMNPSILRSQTQETVHGRTDVGRTTDDCCYVNLQLDGSCAVSQLGQESRVEPGHFTVVDTTEPYAFRLQGAWRIMSFRIPRAALAERLPLLTGGLARSYDARAGAGAVVGSLMRTLWTIGGTVDGRATGDMADSFAAAVSAVMPADLRSELRTERAALRQAVLAHARAHLSDPDLSVTTMARRFAVSPRTLHNAFAEHDESFAAAVRSLRLDSCARRLADPACHATIAELASGHGFVDASSFSRAFRRRYGIPPREVRGTGQVG